MRVITGLAKGRRLDTLNGTDVRPTTDMVKEAIFSAIQFDIEGRAFLDLFAGSGQIGIEAISRGAKSATFIDSNPDAIAVIKSNLSKTGFTDKASVIRGEYNSFLVSTKEKFDVAFLDPPYRLNILDKALNAVTRVMNNHGIIICEHPTDVSVPEVLNGFRLDRQRKYSKIVISIYRKDSEEI